MALDSARLKNAKNILRGSAWLTGVRATLVVRMWGIVMLPVLLVTFWTYLQVGLTNGIGKVIGEDFVNYWMGAKFALAGNGADVYNFQTFLNAIETFAGTSLEPYHYSYPPHLLLLTLPLAFLPFLPALVLWTMMGGVACFAFLKSMVQGRQAVLAFLASPAAFVNALYGQNGALTAVFLGGGLMVLRTHPIAAGLLFGALSYKPHLGLLIPLALACGGHWRAFGAATFCVVALVLTSAGGFGIEAWSGFVDRMGMMSGVILAHGEGVWHRMPTMFVSARLLGFSPEVSWALQAPVALAAMFAVGRQWRRPKTLDSIKASTLVLAALLVTPYAWDYDLLVVTLIFVWRLKDGAWRPWEPLALTLVMLLPFILAPAVKVLGLPIGPLVIGWALWTVSQPSGLMSEPKGKT